MQIMNFMEFMFTQRQDIRWSVETNCVTRYSNAINKQRKISYVSHVFDRNDAFISTVFKDIRIVP